MADIFDEVSEDLRAERARQFAKRYAGVAVGLALLVVAGAAGWQVWRGNQAAQADRVAGEFIAATRGTAEPEAARATLDRLGQGGPEGYRTLAILRGAALRAGAGDLPGALALWDGLSKDAGADPLLRDLAALMWVQHQADTGDAAALDQRLQPLLAPTNPWRPLAAEAQAWVWLRAGDETRARTALQGLATDINAPQGVRGRANGLLSRLGGQPGDTTGTVE